MVIRRKVTNVCLLKVAGRLEIDPVQIQGIAKKQNILPVIFLFADNWAPKKTCLSKYDVEINFVNDLHIFSADTRIFCNPVNFPLIAAPDHLPGLFPNSCSISGVC